VNLNLKITVAGGKRGEKKTNGSRATSFGHRGEVRKWKLKSARENHSRRPTRLRENRPNLPAGGDKTGARGRN